MRSLLAVLLIACGSAFATTTYIAATPGVFSGGVACNGQTAITPTTWNATTLAAGDISWVCGPFTGSAGQTLLTFHNGGTVGNNVVLNFDTTADMAAPYWGGSGSGAINVTVSNVTIDGKGAGVIENTANGTSLANQQPSSAIYLSGTANVTVQNLTISNICQHTSNTDTVACNNGGNNDHAIKIINGATGLVIQGNTIHDAQNCIEFNGNSGDTVTIQQNTISRCNWGIGGFGLSSTFIVTGNDISCVAGGACNWGTTADTFHDNGIILFPQSGNMSGVVISNNYFHDIGGTTGSSGTETGHIFFDPGGTGNVPNAQIFNNVLVTTASGVGPTNGYITDAGSGTAMYNNVISGTGAHGIDSVTSPTIKNNIITGMQVGIYLNTGFTGVSSNFNDFFGLTGNGSGIMCVNSGSTCYASVAAWHTAQGFDTNSIITAPNLTAAYVPNSGSPVIGTGTNLTSLGIAGLDVGAPQTFGASYACGTGCVARPSSAAWDIGAYQFASPPIVSSGQLSNAAKILNGAALQ